MATRGQGMRVLVVEDDPLVQSLVARALRREGFEVELTGSVASALSSLAAAARPPDAVLLDLGLPDRDGCELLAHLRRNLPGVPVVVLTARGAVANKVTVLDSGAHDYVTKPFAVAELVARVRAALRARGKPSTTLAVGDLVLDLVARTATRGGRSIELSAREWALLEIFMRHPRQLLSRTQLLSEVWDFGFDPGSNVVDVYVGYLRRKINGPGEEPYIHTIRGAGYRFLRQLAR